MTHKNRHVLGCYDTVDKVVEVIRDLKAKGFENEDITLVTREDYAPQYSEKTDVRFTTEEDVLKYAEKKPSDEQNLWDKVTDAFSVESRTHGTPTPDYQTDDDPLYGYQENLDRGCVVVMVDGSKWERSQEKEEPVPEPDAEALLNATDAMRSNVIMSTGSETVLDSEVGPEEVDEKNLHDHSSHTD